MGQRNSSPSQTARKKIAPQILQLSGTPIQMGRAHGIATREKQAQSCVSFYGTMIDRLFGFQIRSAFERSLRKNLRWFVANTLEQKFIENIPHRYRQTMEGFVQGSDLPESLLLKGLVMPDVYSYLLAQKHNLIQGPRFEPIALGCTSFVSLGNVSQGIPFLHARNLDFPGGHYWNDFPTIIEYNPDDGQRYISVTSLGIETAGITGMNEAGMCISLNMHFSINVRAGGVPIIIMGHEVMRRATSLESAVEILTSFPAAGGWSFLISSYREKNAIVAEMDAQHLRLRGVRGNQLVSTNHYLDPDIQPYEYWITKGRALDSKARYHQTDLLLRNMNGKLEVSDAIKILANSFDPDLERDRAYGYTISQVHTVTSVIFEPAERRVYFACGPSPVAQQNFYAFDVFPGPILRDGVIQGVTFNKEQEARFHYSLAYESYFPENDLARAASHLEHTVALNPNENLYWSMLAFIQLKRQRIREAHSAMEKALQIKDNAYRENQNLLYFARILDLGGNRYHALEYYRKLSRDKQEPVFKEAAKKGLRKAWTWKKVHGLVLDFILGDAIEV